MHQPTERGQVAKVKVVGFVQHQVAAHKPQHGCDLAAAALAFGGGDQVVNGADQYRSCQQLAHLGVTRDARKQRVRVFVAFDALHLRKLVHQVLSRGRAAGLGLCFVMLKQCTAGRTAHQDGKLLVVQLQQLTKRPPGLQRECA